MLKRYTLMHIRQSAICKTAISATIIDDVLSVSCMYEMYLSPYMYTWFVRFIVQDQDYKVNPMLMHQSCHSGISLKHRYMLSPSRIKQACSIVRQS